MSNCRVSYDGRLKPSSRCQYYYKHQRPDGLYKKRNTTDSRSLDVVGKGDHADGLPRAETNSGADASVETLDAVGLVDVLEGVEDRLLCGAGGVHRLERGLHLVCVSTVSWVTATGDG